MTKARGAAIGRSLQKKRRRPWRPNIVWVMADDLGLGEVGLFPASSVHGRIATPNLDTFGREGMVFTSAYAGYTVCSPSRMSFFTGRHSGSFKQAGLDGWQLHPTQNVPNVALTLQLAGYATGAFGKVAPLTAPLQQGFDDFVGQVDQAYCHNMFPRMIDAMNGTSNFNMSGNWRRKNRRLCMRHSELYNYTVDVFHDQGMLWLESVSTGHKPFFLYLSYTIPHAGGWRDPPWSTEEGNPVPTDLHYADMPWPAVEKDHAAAVTYLDHKVGDLMARLASLGVDDKTLVIFASDNGASDEGGGHRFSFFDSSGGLHGQKRSFFEGGVRSPTMARWPGVIPANSSSDFAWAFWDVLPTLAELAGIQAPPGLDGLSIVPTLLGQGQAPHEYLFWSWAAHGTNTPGYAVRKGHWKGIVLTLRDDSTFRASGNDTMLLYDLTTDPSETADVAHQHLQVAAELKNLVVSKRLTVTCYQCDPH